MYDPKFMDEAILLARQYKSTGLGGPFGAVVVKEGEIIGRGFNQVTILNDPTAHAEVMAIRNACGNLGHFQLTGCEIYSSCEPCPMCLGAIYWARPDIIYYGADRKDAAAAGFDDSFIYDELNLPPHLRRISAEKHESQEAVSVFEEWIKWENKKEY